jgi:hypothetical protein
VLPCIFRRLSTATHSQNVFFASIFYHVKSVHRGLVFFYLLPRRVSFPESTESRPPCNPWRPPTGLTDDWRRRLRFSWTGTPREAPIEELMAPWLRSIRREEGWYKFSKVSALLNLLWQVTVYVCKYVYAYAVYVCKYVCAYAVYVCKYVCGYIDTYVGI